jgi:paraquat-inducible protein A
VRRSNAVTAALALAALVLYPLAISLPMIRVEQFGHHQEASIVKGAVTLIGSGQVVVGLIVLVCSVVLPLGKLLALLVLSSAAGVMGGRHRALTYRVVEFTGRWGMLDVLLVAILVAVLKIGDLMDVSAGPAALAFTSCVVLSLLASASFDPHALWVSGAACEPTDEKVGENDSES